ncbi:uncharacterized protein HD556DRAFT_1042302 [Suillus plorans]|uniref:Uncharacterized protein n=1 Tax=Suillus plorans TaxID=116603 RepID=A0A9P7ACG7_9AGAM|nr:uncharacterized protein HD556DRAFT_1042302 [Suillus plorans]KAG1786590.1 hypothetical protein HD556DRAFT_1042302 [Suillus plorans]
MPAIYVDRLSSLVCLLCSAGNLFKILTTIALAANIRYRSVRPSIIILLGKKFRTSSWSLPRVPGRGIVSPSPSAYSGLVSIQPS